MACFDPPFFSGIEQFIPRDPDDDIQFVSRDDLDPRDAWAAVPSVDAASRFVEPLMVHLHRVVKPGGPIVVMADPRSTPAWMVAAESAGLVWMAEIVVLWNEGMPRARNFGSLHTNILWFARPGARHPWASDRRTIYSNVLVATKIPRQHRVHPTQKPVELTTFLISLLSKRGDVVLDPLCGSGSTLVSAAICDRPFVGIDIDDRYCKIARRRAMHFETEDEGELFLWRDGKMDLI